MASAPDTAQNRRHVPPTLPTMNLDWSFGAWLLVLDWVIRLGALLWIPVRSTPAAARSWLLLVGFVPLLGLPLYLLFGHPWLSRERIARQARASLVIREELSALATQRWAAPATQPLAAEIAPLVQRLGDFTPVHGNAIALLDDYGDCLARLVADIDAASERVHLLYYLMFEDAVGEDGPWAASELEDMESG